MRYVRAIGNVARRLHEQLAGSEKVRMRRLQRNGTVTLGEGTYGYPTVQTFVHEDLRLIVGNYTSLALGATFLLGGEHPLERTTTFPFRTLYGLEGAGEDGFPRTSKDTVVGSDVWIGAGALILAGRRIGHGAVIAGGTVVTRDVPAFAVVAGNPGRIIRYRHTEAQRDALLDISWWDWPAEQVLGAVPLLSDPDVDAFISYARSLDAKPVP